MYVHSTDLSFSFSTTDKDYTGLTLFLLLLFLGQQHFHASTWLHQACWDTRSRVLHVEVCGAGPVGVWWNPVRLSAQVSTVRSAAAAWPRSHASQAGGRIDRSVIKSGALAELRAAHCSRARPAAAVYSLPYALFNGPGAPRERGPIQGASCPCFVLLIFN